MFISNAEKAQIQIRLSILERAFNGLMEREENKKKGHWTVEKRNKQSQRMKDAWAKKKIQGTNP
jgi:hypothetical protein